jgi:CRISPR-associated protein Csd2
MKAIENKFEFLILFDCENGNPNGDPDADNLPRQDEYDQHGMVSNNSIKRRIRDYAQLLGKEIFVQLETNLNGAIFEAREKTGDPKAIPTKERTHKASAWMCERYFDVRTFGAVMNTGANAGQVTGPVQINWARSVDPVQVMEFGITRVATTKKVPKAKKSEDFKRWEKEQPQHELKTMGRYALIPYGLFIAKGFISAVQAQKSGFSPDDLKTLSESIMNMFEHNRTASKGLMTTRRLILFKHVGVRENPEQRIQQAILGCAPAQRLLEDGQIITVKRLDDQKLSRKYADYSVFVNKQALPRGVEMLDMDVWDEETFDEWLGGNART